MRVEWQPRVARSASGNRICAPVMKKRNTAPIPDNVTEIILESISDGVFTVDHEWRIMSFNRAAEKITGIPRKEAIGRHCWEVFRSNMCEGDCALRRTMAEGASLTNTSTYIINSEKKRIPMIRRIDRIVSQAQPMSMAWEPTFFRLAHWNKFSYPKKGYFKYSNWKSTFHYWWYDEKKVAKLKKAMKKKTKLKN